MNQPATHIDFQTSHLSIGYPTRKESLEVLSDINLSVNQPELIAIIGKNGVGKSTLLRTLAGLQPALSGSYAINGKQRHSYTPLQWAQMIAVVLTEVPQHNDFTVYEMVAFGRQTYTNWLDQHTISDKKKIQEALEITHIWELSQKRFAELSDGQRQKVMIARALAQDTPIIMLDEPTVHLDIHHSMEMFVLFQKLVQKHQKTVILTTHEIGLSVKLADVLWVIDQGKIFTDKTQQIVQNQIISQVFDTDLIRFNIKTMNFEYR
ncbi:MAG: ABC transporter ATP-binding protein [Flavobacteriaceae bacterium]|nr:ABC transporter ATP-binding protein [Flavobacteriaceae bacterium]